MVLRPSGNACVYLSGPTVEGAQDDCWPTRRFLPSGPASLALGCSVLQLCTTLHEKGPLNHDSRERFEEPRGTVPAGGFVWHKCCACGCSLGSVDGGCITSGGIIAGSHLPSRGDPGSRRVRPDRTLLGACACRGFVVDCFAHRFAYAGGRSSDVERFQPGSNHAGRLPRVSALDTLLVASFSFGVISRAHYGMSHRTLVRRQANGDGYVTSASVLSNGQVSLGLSRVSNRVVTSLARVPVAATLTTGKVLNVQTRVVGTTRVQLHARVWVAGAPIPGWQIALHRLEPCGDQVAGGCRHQCLHGFSGSGSGGHADAAHQPRVVGVGIATWNDSGPAGSSCVRDARLRSPPEARRRGRASGGDSAGRRMGETATFPSSAGPPRPWRARSATSA